MYARQRAIVFKVAKKKIWPKAAEIAARCWMTKEIGDNLNEREKVRRNEGTYTVAYNRLSEEVSRLTTEV